MEDGSEISYTHNRHLLEFRCIGQNVKIKAGESGSILDVLKKAVGTDSSTRIRKYIRHGRVHCNGRQVLRADMNVKSGDVLEVTRDPAAGAHRVEPPVPILYEDRDLVAVEKPAGMLTIGAESKKNPSLYRLMNLYARKNAFHRASVFVVHRLDREVSGIVIFAKSREIQKRIKHSWPSTEKRYYALVEGRPPKAEGTVESWLAEDGQQKVRSVPKSTFGARNAVTHYRTLKELRDHTLLEILLETGRKNQIRVHMADIGCPIVGDRRYGASDRFVRRIRLHGFLFAFNHPAAGNRIRIHSRMPAGFLKLGQKDEKYK